MLYHKPLYNQLQSDYRFICGSTWIKSWFVQSYEQVIVHCKFTLERFCLKTSILQTYKQTRIRQNLVFLFPLGTVGEG